MAEPVGVNVLYYLKNYPKLSQSFVLNELAELDRRGHNVAVFARDDPEEAIQHNEYSEHEIPVRYADHPSAADLPDLFTPTIFNGRVLRRALYYTHPTDHARYLHLAQQCIEYVDALPWNPDLIHCHFAHPNKFPATYAAAYFDIPSTVTAHAYEIFRDPNMRLFNLLLARMSRVIVPSRYNRTYLRNQLGVAHPIDVIPATTQVSKFSPTDREVPTRILTIGRLVEKKGIVYAIEALARLNELYPESEYRYHIIGTGERESELRQRAMELGVDDQVVFLGNVSDDRLERELDEAAVFVLPCVIAEDGDRDAMPVVLKEAMAMMTPCVSTTVSAVPELIEDGTDGLLVEPHDARGLAEAIGSLLTDEDERRRMGRRARKTVATKFDIETIGKGLVTSFEAAAEGYHVESQ